ncbi:hypothetical protein GQ42DRAFT_5886 [Ramicandelaber brevisporus]|nr:hypothetical protein GQ42DRAFT_5886 [Ramicandelaber brevisporus]
MNYQAYFRLFDLPGELVEYVSFFFDIGEAHKLLTVSSEFHSLFSRRLWWKLDSRVFSLPQPIRSTAIARYGKLVRDIDLDDEICFTIKPDVDKGANIRDILSVFSGVATLCVWNDHQLLVSNRIQFRDIIMCFPSLYKLDIKMENDNEPYDLVTLALAINHRQSNRSMRPIESLVLVYFARSINNPWTRLSNFVQMILCTGIANIEINPRFLTPFLRPSQSELGLLSKYFVETPQLKKREDAQFCYATLNRILISGPSAGFHSCSYPQSRRLSIRTCCMGSDTYDYCDITPVNFPCIESIEINGHECINMISHSYPPAWKKVLLQNWHHLYELTLSVSMTCEQLVTVLERNCRLTSLDIWLYPKMLDENSVFNLAKILPVFPKLQRLTIHGNNIFKLDSNPDYDDYEVLAQLQIYNIQLSGLVLSSRIFKLLYCLPELEMIAINHCRLYSTGAAEAICIDGSTSDPNETEIVDYDVGDDSSSGELMAMLNIISAKYMFNNPCSIKSFHLHDTHEDYEWPLDVTLEMIALMPELRSFEFDGEIDEIPSVIKARFPYVDVRDHS